MLKLTIPPHEKLCDGCPLDDVDDNCRLGLWHSNAFRGEYATRSCVPGEYALVPMAQWEAAKWCVTEMRHAVYNAGYSSADGAEIGAKIIAALGEEKNDGQ